MARMHRGRDRDRERRSNQVRIGSGSGSGSMVNRLFRSEGNVDSSDDRRVIPMTQRAFKDVRGAGAESGAALPVDRFMQGLEALQAEIATEKNRVWERVADGTLSLPLLKRLAKEYYFLGKWYTC